MIKFFRHIRKSLIEENRMGKYFKYAIGEILLVVIGILIALQINNWNEARNERLREVKYLKNLKADLLSEIKNNSEFKTLRIEKAKSCSKLINGKAPETIEDVQNYTATYEHVFLWSEFVPNRNTFKELLSSGNLSLISNDSIKDGLLGLEEYYAMVETGEHHMRREYEAYLYDPHVKNIAAISFFDINKLSFGLPQRIGVDAIPKSKHQKLIEDAQWQHNNQTFNNGLRLAFMNNSYLAGVHNDIVNYLAKLVALINEEIEPEIHKSNQLTGDD